MKQILSSIFLVFFIAFSFAGHAFVPYKLVAPEKMEKDAISSEQMTKAELRMEAKVAKRKAKLNKRLAKFKTKMAKRGITGENGQNSVWDDSRFRLGALFLIVAIALGIVGALGILSGLFNFVGSILAIAGIVLVIWALVTY